MFRLFSLVTVLSLVFGSSAAFAKPNVGANPANGEINQLAQKQNQGGRWQQLNLSAEQQQQMAQIKARYKGDLDQRKQALQQAKDQLRQLMASNASAEQIRAQHRQVQSLKQQMGDVKFEEMLAMREILTPEQRQQLAEKMNRGEGMNRGERNRPNRGQ